MDRPTRNPGAGAGGIASRWAGAMDRVDLQLPGLGLREGTAGDDVRIEGGGTGLLFVEFRIVSNQPSTSAPSGWWEPGTAVRPGN